MERAVPDSWEADVVLRDGHTVRMRSIRPDDAGLITRFHERQSPESIYFRFFSPRPRLSERELEHFTRVDHRDRVAFVALLDDELVGVARYERYEGTDTAEVAFFVDDRHHGRGLATVMLEYLAAAARENGITRFRATTLPNNRKMLKVFASAGYEVASQLDDGIIDVAFDLRPTDEVTAAVDRRERLAEAASVRRMLEPATVALIDAGAGGPRSTTGPAHRPVPIEDACLVRLAERLRDGAFPGSVTLGGPAALDELPEGVDLVVVAGPAAALPEVLDRCADRAAGAVVVLSEADASQTEAILEVVRRRGLRLLGPGSLGVCNTDPAVALDALCVEARPLPGTIGVLSESGEVVSSVLDHARRVGLGISTLVSTAEPADLNVADLLSYWADDDRTRAVLLHLGSAPLPSRFVRAARAASRARTVAALASTARVAGGRPSPEQRRDRAMLRQSGVIPVASLQELFAIGRLLADQPPPGGRGVAVVGASRAAVDLAVDACAAAGLDPVTGHVGPAPDSLAAAASEPTVRSVVVIDTTPGPLPPPDLVDAVLGFSRDHSELTVVISAVGSERPARLVDDATGVAVPLFTFPEHAGNALGRLATAREWRSTARVYGDETPSGLDVDATRALVERWRADGGPDQVLELDASRQEQLLAACGLRVADRREVRTVEQAVAAAEEIGWPVALKARRRDRRKRTALSGVALDVAGVDDLSATWARMEEALGPEGMQPVVVQRMVEQGLDVAVRIRRPDRIGTVEVGLGGPMAAFDPWELGVLPLALPDASMLVAASSVARALTDPLNRVPVVSLVHRLAALVDAVEEIHEVRADPVIVAGPVAWITDVRILIGSPRGELPVRHLG
ncbi:MAG: GNAT family N-acetyltransferase [Microthrixaceae bacterium]|nr:GNAT family N-acetyltransferase [Microthrixaceae bacterium]MCO5305415.1 GNAT family N-acetyltransferase [Microthrixaceae bacterium]